MIAKRCSVYTSKHGNHLIPQQHWVYLVFSSIGSDHYEFSWYALNCLFLSFISIKKKEEKKKSISVSIVISWLYGEHWSYNDWDLNFISFQSIDKNNFTVVKGTHLLSLILCIIFILFHRTYLLKDQNHAEMLTKFNMGDLTKMTELRIQCICH